LPVIRRALVSVSDKAGIAEFCKGLAGLGVELVSTGGTARTLKEAGIQVKEVSELTGFPEMLDGRVKTLHPKVHGGILADHSKPEHMATLEQHGIPPIDMVVVNLYPFEAAASKSDIQIAELVEEIDIGGPTLVRAAAKNHAAVAVVVDPGDYDGILKELAGSKELSATTLQRLAVKAFQHTAGYDAVISGELEARLFPDRKLPSNLRLRYDVRQPLRYGENPHQHAAFYVDPMYGGVGVASCQQLHGKELSYNNILDLDTALEIVREFKQPCVAILKHNNPCGVACAGTIADAYRAALACDSMSAFGGIVALNRELDLETAQEIRKLFTECVVAPGYGDDALKLLKKKKNIRLLLSPKPITRENMPGLTKYTHVRGGMLAQTQNWPELKPEDLKVVTENEPTDEQVRAMLFGVKVCRHIKSNTVLLVKGTRTVGVGAGQMSRVDSSIISGRKAGEEAKGSVMVSDAFFPFRDGIDAAAEVGVAAIIQPGGSIRDQEVIDAADGHGMAMVFSGLRLFKH